MRTTLLPPSEAGPKLAIVEALERADIDTSEVATWDMHATATPGDWTELNNARDIFGEDTRYTARKGTFGHGMSVCGGWELTAQHLGVAQKPPLSCESHTGRDQSDYQGTRL